jgi:enoyl-CoA hydratase/carnithine racemase
VALVRVERSHERRVATVTLSRPDVRNALSVPLLAELTDAFGELTVDPGVHAVVLAGDGQDFCAGADLGELEAARARGRDGALDFDAPFRDALRAVAVFPTPVIARVQGRALGGGCQLVLACDMAVAARDASLGIPSARLGVVIPFDSVRRLVLAVGPKRAGEMLYTARAVTGEEARAWGLVARAVPALELDEAVDELVEHVVAGAPLSVRASKRGIALASDPAASDRSGERTGATDYDLMAADALGSEDLGEGIAAFRERRPPAFGGR